MRDEVCELSYCNNAQRTAKAYGGEVEIYHHQALLLSLDPGTVGVNGRY